jgi:hypothetical protein
MDVTRLCGESAKDMRLLGDSSSPSKYYYLILVHTSYLRI